MMLNRLAVPIFILDVDGEDRFRFTFLNKAHEKSTGLRLADIAGKTPEEIWAPRMAEQLNSNFRKCLKRCDDYTYEEFLSLPSGEKWWQTTLSPVLDDNGKVVQIYGVAADITERKLLELDQAKRQSELFHRSELLTTYTKTAAHDLRSPLCQLDLLLQMILIGFEDLGDGKKGLLERSQVVVGNSIKYLDAVFEYSRSMVELGDGQKSALDFGHLCSDLLSILDPNGNHDVAHDKAIVSVDSTVTQVLLRNLLDNAIKHNAGKNLSIGVQVEADKPGWLRFSVGDNGKGFPEGFAIGGADAAGTGFGLRGAKRLATGSGGKLWICESAGDPGGACVCFTLPGKFLTDDDLDDAWRQADLEASAVAETLAA